MRIGNLDAAISVRNSLEKLVDVRSAVNNGRLEICAVYQGDQYDVERHSAPGHATRIRTTIAECLTELIDREIEKLEKMGVETGFINSSKATED